MSSAFRFVRRRPLFFWAMVATLALGVGANTAMFAAVRTVFIDPLPWAEPERVVVFEQVDHFSPTAGLYAGDVEVLESLQSLSTVAGCAPTRIYTSRVMPAVQIMPMEVTARFFEVFGVPPLFGRTFGAADFASGGVAVLSYDLWQMTFSGDESVIGRRVNLGHQEATVVGVMPRRFQPHCWELNGPIAWIPHEPSTVPARQMSRLLVFARLAPGATIEGADAERAALARHWATDYADDHLEEFILAPVQTSRATSLRSSLMLLQVVAGLLLLITSANLAGAFLVNASERQQEFAIRASLGATPWQIVRLVGGETLAVAIAGAAVGAVLALGTIGVLGPLAAPVIPGVVLTVDWRDALAAFAIAAGSLAVFGTMAALAASQTARLRSSTATGSSRAANRLRAAFVVAQVALTVVLLIGGTVLLRSYRNAVTSPAGFETREVLTTDVHLPPATSPAERQLTFQRVLNRLDAELAQVSAVADVAFAQHTPFSGGNGVRVGIKPPGAARPVMRSFSVRPVSPNYFSVLGIPVLRGRPFAAAPGNIVDAVVSENFSTLFEPGQELLSAIVELPSGPLRIVGVVGNTKSGWLTVEGQPRMYVPIGLADGASVSVVARARTVPAATTAIREVIARVNPGGPPTAVEPLEAIMWRSEQVRRFYVVLTAAFGIVGVLVSALGIFNVVARTVTLRSKDFAVRVALGAGQRRVATIVFVEAFRPVAVGVIAGVAGGFALARLLETRPLQFAGLYGVSATDLTTYGIATLIALVTAAFASLAPLRRAVRIAPAEVLKGD